MALAIFDLDNTLLAGDSDALWGEFLCQQQAVDADSFRTSHHRFHEDYQAGRLDMDAFLHFALAPLKGRDHHTLSQWQGIFLNEFIRPIVAPAAFTLLTWHRQRHDNLIIITATNSFVTQPIAQHFKIEHLLASEAELTSDGYSGKPIGIPCYQDGKVKRLYQWLEDTPYDLDGSWFYSDSHNDIPLLSIVDHPVVVDPDEYLRKTAMQRKWPIMTLRGGTVPIPSPGELLIKGVY